MTTEKKLRDYARSVVSAARLRDDAVLPSDFPDLTDTEFERLCDLVALYPILDLQVLDRQGYLWPRHGRNYGNVHISHADPSEIVISRGGPGEASRHTSMTLTREESLELASILTAAAMVES